jgi:hypothetical protein
MVSNPWILLGWLLVAAVVARNVGCVVSFAAKTLARRRSAAIEALRAERRLQAARAVIADPAIVDPERRRAARNLISLHEWSDRRRAERAEDEARFQGTVRARLRGLMRR